MKEQKIDKVLENAEDQVKLEDMPLTSMREYRLYNEAAAKMNKKLRRCEYPIKPCPIELHPKERVVFNAVDQPTNPHKVHVSNSIIHFDETLIPGKTYDLPEYIVHYLAEKANPNWGWVDLPDGGRETRHVGKKHRFNLRRVYEAV